MPNVLIRDIPEQELRELKAAAASRSMSLQAYLLEAVAAQAAYERRTAALDHAALRLEGKPPLSPSDRAALRRAIDRTHTERTESLTRRARKR